MAGTDLFAPSAGLDAGQQASGTDLFADPNAPGPFVKGVKSSVSSLKGAAAGALALAGDLAGVDALKQYGLHAAEAADKESAKTAMAAEDVGDLKGAADYLKYGIGYTVPQLGISALTGVLGRVGGGVVARSAGLTDAAKVLLAKNTGMIAGLGGSAIAQEAGSIYPDAVEAGLPDAAARAVIGGTAAGSLELLPELVAAKMLGLFGKGAVRTGKGVLKGAAKGVVGGAAAEGATEGAQTYIERLAANQPMDTPEARSDFINSILLGAIGGGAVGGPVGAIHGAGSGTPAPQPAPAAPVAATPTEPAPAPQPTPEQPTAFQSAQLGAFPFTSDSLRILGAPAEPVVEPTRKTTIVSPTIIGEQPKAVEFKPIITPQEDEMRRIAETEATNAARQGSFKGSVRSQRESGTGSGTTAQAGGGDSLLRAAQSGREVVNARRQSSVETQLGLIKKSRGLLLTAEEAKGVRDFEKNTPAIALPSGGTPRETIRQFTPEQRRENFAAAYTKGVDTIIGGLSKSGALKPQTATSLTTALKRAVDVALKQPDAESAASTFNAQFDKAVKNKLPKGDAETFRSELTALVAQELPKESAPSVPLKDRVVDVSGTKRQETLFNKGASAQETGQIEFTHWGDVPGGVTQPHAFGTGKKGADVASANAVGLKYTSAIVKGTPFDESGITERQQYEGRLPLDRVYQARSDDPLLAQARQDIAVQHGPSEPIAWMQYAKKVRDLGYDAILYANGQMRIFTPQPVSSVATNIFRHVLPHMQDQLAYDRAKQVFKAHMATGGSSTVIPTGKDMLGAQAYSVSTFKQREVVLLGQPTSAGIAQYIRANDDLLSNPNNILGTWYDADANHTYLDVSVLVPRMGDALALARKHDQFAVFDLRTATTINLGHPLFDIAQQYNAANDMTPIQEVEYIEFDPAIGKQIARAYDGLKAVNPDQRVKEAFEAMGREEDQMFAAVSQAIKIEPWTKEGQPYQNSAEMRADVFGKNHLYVFTGGEPHPYRTPEQVFKGRAVHDLFAHARTGFEFGARGELNATRVHAQMYSEKALPALIVDNIGQNAWVNFSDANEGKPANERAFAAQKVDLLPESTWRSLLVEPRQVRANAVQRQERILTSKGQDVLDYLESIVGSPADLEVRAVNNLAGGVGALHINQAKAIIELATTAKDVLSVAAHEGYHYLEMRSMPTQDRDVVRRAFAYGSPLFLKLSEKVRAYDRANKTDIESEINAVPAEARAYAFEFWRRGELEVDGVLDRIFAALRRTLERVRNYVDGLGFNSYEDIFNAIEKGDYARRELQGMRTGTLDQSYLESVEADALPGGVLLHRNREAASAAKGRPAWIKTPGDLRKMRKLLHGLATEGAGAKDWYRRSAAAIMAWAGGDTEKAGKMASLVAMYSPRREVGQDIRSAVQHYAQWEAGQPIDAGGTQHQTRYGTQILDGTGHRDYLNKYVLPGNPASSPKITSFFKNMMQVIDPVSYPKESQDTTIDMWMSHIFGFGAKDGQISDSNYWWADAEMKKLAADMGVDPDQAQAAIWVSIKARGNMVRAEARRQGIANNWFTRSIAPSNERTDLMGKGGRPTVYKLKPKHEFDYMVNWIKLALTVPFSQANFDDANYSYAEALRDIADGSLKLNRLDTKFELDAGLFDDIAFGKVTQGSLTFYSRAASLGEMAQRVREGEIPRTQMNAMWADAVDKEGTEGGLRDNFLRSAQAEIGGLGGTFKRFYANNFSSGLNLSRHSVGFKNVFNALTAYTQRKNRLIADTVERQLSEWTGHAAGTQEDKVAVSKALLTRTEHAWSGTSPEFRSLRESLTLKQRAMFDQATRMIGDRLDAELKADTVTYRKLFSDDAQFAEWYENRSAQVQRLKEEGYFPERRFGDHVVHAFVPGEGGKRITVYYSQHEREGEARQELAELKKNLDGQGLTFEYGYRYRADYDASLSFSQFLDMAGRHGIKMTQNEKERIGKALIAADSTRRNRIFRRKNVAGYSEDGMRVLAEFGVTMANKVAYSELGGAINDALAGKEVQAQFTPQGEVEINTYDRDMWGMDGEKGGYYRNLADQTVDFVMAPQARNGLSKSLRTAASLQFLGGSAAAALVNMTSIPMNTVPWLTQHTSYTDAFGKTLAAMKLAGQHLSTIKDLPKLLDTATPMEGIDDVDGLRRALQIAAQDGTILDTEIYQIMGLSRGQEYSLSGRTQKAVAAWMSPFRWAEQFNRVTTFVAAYNVAKQKNLTNDQAYKLAQDTVYATQFRYDEANRPALARGPVGSLLFTFKSYPIFMLETLTHLARENPRSAVYMLLSLAIMSGAEGLPFAEDLEDVIDTIAQRIFNSPFNSKRALRNVLKSASEAVVGADLSSVMMHGMANELTGLSFASRVGLGNLIPGSRLGAADADYKRTMSDLLGPIGSLIEGTIGGADSLSRGQFSEAARQMLPLAGQNMVKGWQQYEKGFATDLGGRKLVDVDGLHAFWQALGFSSSALAGAYDSDKIDKQTSAFYTQAKQDFEKDMVKAIRDKKPEEVAQIVNAVTAWNQAHPEMPMAISSTSVRKQIMLGNMPMNQRTFKLLPKQLRGQSESALGLEQ